MVTSDPLLELELDGGQELMDGLADMCHDEVVELGVRWFVGRQLSRDEMLVQVAFMEESFLRRELYEKMPLVKHIREACNFC